MKLKLVVAMLAAILLAGCSKCSQQQSTVAPTAEAPAAAEASVAVEASADESQLVEGATGEAMPTAEEMNEELPPAEDEGQF